VGSRSFRHYAPVRLPHYCRESRQPAAAIADRILFLADGRIVKELGRSEPRDVATVMEQLGR